MKSWYRVTAFGVNHRSQIIEVGKLIYLTQLQAQQHGSKIEPGSDPLSIDECAFFEEYDQWQQDQNSSVEPDFKPPSSELESSPEPVLSKKKKKDK